MMTRKVKAMKTITLAEFYDLLYSISVGLAFLALVMTFFYVVFGKSSS